jgi:peptide deformylase
MAKLPIITLPDQRLRKTSEPIKEVDDKLRKLMDDMLETMYAAPGVGLAAVQVGLPIRLIVLDTAKDEEPPHPLAMVNPEISKQGEERHMHEEGCLSIPDVRVEIERPSTVTVCYTDRDGKRQELEADGLLATAVQHEIDHLNGKLIIDYLSKLKRDMIVRKFKKQAKAEAEEPA